ncbi:TIGR02452 family protein [Paenibacillus bovis]|uniref:TIGR02452 family protein n=1 Tax=Paenibacillus bovis TaxID=1616788 RepID=A0A172ZI85_9BACL|nr:TIGR02452 family protein [Paenibacillus bovis]ANF97355.1 TIGR02452 family protein [Paenibacillus bovis]
MTKHINSATQGVKNTQGAREIRSRWAQETLDILDNGQYINAMGETITIHNQIKYTIDHSRLYRPSELPDIQHAVEARIREQADTLDTAAIYQEIRNRIECTNESTLAAAQRLAVNEEKQHVLALNFASARNPGGGFLGGSQAQEESLARSSSLYPAIVQMEEMYKHNRQEKSCLYSDYMIYSPDVTIFREDQGQLRDQPYQVSMITAPAVNAGVVREREPEREHEIELVMKQRIRYILATANEQGEENLILGAYGCGVFRNRPEEVARWFHDILFKEGYGLLFYKIVFAILDRSKTGGVMTAFQTVFE